jgi:hypothetical protein
MSGQPATPSKRRKSITNLFGASIRGHNTHTITSGSPERQPIVHKNQLNLISPHNEHIANNDQRQEEQVNVLTGNMVQAAPIYRLHPIPRVQFATSDANDDPFEQQPEATIVCESIKASSLDASDVLLAYREIKPSTEERRSCSASTGTCMFCTSWIGISTADIEQGGAVLQHLFQNASRETVLNFTRKMKDHEHQTHISNYS